MSTKDEVLLFLCDEAACKEDPMFYEIFSMDDRWSIIRAVLDAAAARASAVSSTDVGAPGTPISTQDSGIVP